MIIVYQIIYQIVYQTQIMYIFIEIESINN